MRSGLVLMAGVMVTGAAVAQQPAAQVRVLPASMMCGTGSLSARQQASGGRTMWTVAQEDLRKGDSGRKATGLGVHVRFEASSNPVQSLELRVRYLPLKLHVLPVEGKSAPGEDPNKTFVLKQDASLEMDGDLLVGPAATIQSVHLVSATFADGGVWRAPSDEACTVEPSRILLVAGK